MSICNFAGKPYLPADPVDFGATQDNCGNVVVWIRPRVLDEIVSELENGGDALGILREIKAEFAKCLFPIPEDNPDLPPLEDIDSDDPTNPAFRAEFMDKSGFINLTDAEHQMLVDGFTLDYVKKLRGNKS